MDRFARKHLTDGALLTGFRAHVSNERGSLADVLADIAEIDERKLYVPAAHPSMVSYMVHEMRFTEQAALKRLRAARLGREFPSIFTAVATGQLNLSAIVMLSGHLSPENVDQLVATAANMGKTDLERVLRGRDGTLTGQLALTAAPQLVADTEGQLSPGRVEATHISPKVPARTAAAKGEERSELRCMVSGEGLELLDYARVLLGHAIPNGDMGRIVERAAKALVREIEKQKFGATEGRRKPRGSNDPHHISYAIKREVWKRDGGQCAYHSDEGKRCPSRELVQFHHVQEVAAGGIASVENISLRCRTHNQYESEKTFGKEFMENKREQARASAARKRKGQGAEQAPAAPQPTREVVPIWDTCANDDEVVIWLKHYDYSEEDGRWALEKAGPRHGVMPGGRQLDCLYLLRDRDRLQQQSPAVA